MFKNYSDCSHCTHTSVCQYKIQLKEAYDKINGHWDNLATPDIFKLELECKEFTKQDPPAWTTQNNPWA